MVTQSAAYSPCSVYAVVDSARRPLDRLVPAGALAARAVAVEDSEVALGIRIALLRGLGSFTGVRNNGGSYYRP